MSAPGNGAGERADRARAVVEAGVNQTSARFLLSCAPMMLGTDGRVGNGAGAEDRFAALMVMKDLYIKARSYALLNKAAFWPALLLVLASVGWPAIEVVLSQASDAGGGGAEGGVEGGGEGGGGIEELPRAVSSALQSLCSALAGVFAYVYVTYKRKQSETEAAMRGLLFGTDPMGKRVARAVEVIGVLDTGLKLKFLGASDADRADTRETAPKED